MSLAAAAAARVLVLVPAGPRKREADGDERRMPADLCLFVVCARDRYISSLNGYDTAVSHRAPK